MISSIALMCHPRRLQFVTQLMEEIPDAVVVWDENNDMWETGRSAWLKYNADLPYHTVIQDDALACKGFMKRLNEVLKTGYLAYCHFFCTMNHWQYIKQAERGKREGKMISRSLRSGVAVTLSVNLIEDMVSFGDGCKYTTRKLYDSRIGSFLYSKGIDIYYPMPSLVDHRDTESLIGSPKDRRAFFFIP
jgi:hypothetical protein